MIHRAVAQGRTCVHNAAVFVFLNSRIIYVATCATQIIETTHFSTTSTKGWHKKTGPLVTVSQRDAKYFPR